MDGENQDKEEIYSVNFNQDNGCFIVATSLGIRVFNTNEFQSTFFRDFEGGIKIGEMLFRTNIIGFVGTGQNTSYPSNRLILWDDIQHRPFGELNFQGDVLNVKLRKDRVVVVLEQKIYVYYFQDLKIQESIMTCSNPQGLVSLSTVEDSCVLACPDEKIGYVKIIHFSKEQEKIEVKCHNAGIAALKLSQDGTVLVTASNKGTLLRLFNTQTGANLGEVRRGADQAVITDVCIDPTNEFVSCSSDKGTIHIFKIGAGDELTNKKAKLSMLGGISSYFGSEWSFAQFRVKDANCKCAIIDRKIFAISTQGNYYAGEIGHTAGEIKISKSADLLETEQ